MASGSKSEPFFDANDYLRTRFSDLSAGDRVLFQLDNFHKLFQTLPESSEGSVRVLDFGSGPVIQNSISAAAFASEIVFCDISSSNREAVQKWLDGAPDAFDWSPHFDYVVKTLEGKGEKEAREREERMRKISKVAFCDALSKTPMEKGYEGLYAILLECGCLDAACSDKQSYKTCLPTLQSLLRPNGLLVRVAPNALAEGVGRLLYSVSGKELNCIRLTHEFIKSAMEESGFRDVSVTFTPLYQSNTSDYHQRIKKSANGYHFITARK